MTVAAALHQNGPFTTRNGRITREGRRSMAGGSGVQNVAMQLITHS